MARALQSDTETVAWFAPESLVETVPVAVGIVAAAKFAVRRPARASLRRTAVQFRVCAVGLRVHVLDAQVHVPALQGGVQQPQGRWGVPALGFDQRWSYSLPIADSGRVELVSRWFESRSPVARDFQAAA